MTALQIVMEAKLRIRNAAGGNSFVRTSSVARDVGSSIKRQVDQSLDCPVPEGVPDVLVFSSCFLFCRMRCPVDTGIAEIVETNRDGALGLTESGVHVRPQAGDSRSLDCRRGPTDNSTNR